MQSRSIHKVNARSSESYSKLVQQMDAAQETEVLPQHCVQEGETEDVTSPDLSPILHVHKNVKSWLQEDSGTWVILTIFP